MPENDLLDNLNRILSHILLDLYVELCTSQPFRSSNFIVLCVCDTSERLHRVNSFLLYLGMTGMCQPKTEIALRVELLQSSLR